MSYQRLFAVCRWYIFSPVLCYQFLKNSLTISVNSGRAKIVYTDYHSVVYYECKQTAFGGTCPLENVRLEVLQRGREPEGGLYLTHQDLIRNLCLDPKQLSLVTHDGNPLIKVNLRPAVACLIANETIIDDFKDSYYEAIWELWNFQSLTLKLCISGIHSLFWLRLTKRPFVVIVSKSTKKRHFYDQLFFILVIFIRTVIPTLRPHCITASHSSKTLEWCTIWIKSVHKWYKYETHIEEIYQYVSLSWSIYSKLIDFNKGT